jgi:hypothetical protein
MFNYIDAKKSIITKTDWIEEEDQLLNWAENPVFEKQPLHSITLTFIYVNPDRTVVGIAKNTIELEKREQQSSILRRSVFFDKVSSAKNPALLFPDLTDEWLSKTYIYECASLFNLSLDYESNSDFSNNKMNDIVFNTEYTKIPNALILFHDQYELFVIMREKIELKSILNKKPKSGRKTKKVRISEESPKEFLFSNRSTRKV